MPAVTAHAVTIVNSGMILRFMPEFHPKRAWCIPVVCTDHYHIIAYSAPIVKKDAIIIANAATTMTSVAIAMGRRSVGGIDSFRRMTTAAKQNETIKKVRIAPLVCMGELLAFRANYLKTKKGVVRMVPTLLERTIDRLRNEPVNADANVPDQGLTVGEFLLAQLSAWGVRRIYGVIGDANLFFLDDIAKQSKIQYVPFFDENAAALAASAEAKLTGRVGVVLGTSGPGLANMLNGLGDAYADRAGVLAITGQVDAEQIGTPAKQYIQQQLAVMPFAALSETLAHPDALPELLQRGLALAAARGEVAHIAVPKAMFRERVKGTPAPYSAHFHQPLLAPDADVEETFRLIAGAKRPMLLYGRGVAGAGAKREALAFAEALGAAVAVTMPAKDAFPNDHELFVGGLGLAGSEAASVLMAESDLVVVCGATWWPDEYAPPDARVVQIDVARENIGLGKALVRGLVGDLRDILPRFVRLAESLGRERGEGGGRDVASRASGAAEAAEGREGDRAPWRRRIAEVRGEWTERLARETSAEGTPLAPQRAVRVLSDAVPPEAVVALDSGDHTLWFHRVFANRGQRILVSGRWRTLGFALPAAIAAKLAEPARPVVAVAGDGGVVQTIVELKTAAKLGLNVVLVVFVNGAYAIEKNRMELAGLDPLGSELDNPDFVALAVACGCAGYRAATEDAFRAALAAAFADDRPSVVAVDVAPLKVPHTRM